MSDTIPSISAPDGRDAPIPSELALELDPKAMTFSLIKAGLSYRLRLNNLGQSPIIGLRIHSDLISAHASKADDEQLRGPDMAHAKLHKVDQINPGQNVEISGDLDILLDDIELIHHGEKKMFLPLARFRLIGAGTRPQKRAFVIGQAAPDGTKIRPFRLDSGQSSHKEILSRPLG